MQKMTLDQFQALPVRGWAVSASFFHCCQDSSQNAATVPWKPKLCSETPERLQLTSSLSSLLPTSTSCQPCEGAVLDVIPVGPLERGGAGGEATLCSSGSTQCIWAPEVTAAIASAVVCTRLGSTSLVDQSWLRRHLHCRHGLEAQSSL